MPDSEDHNLSNSFDIFVRGEEILSGGQRIHRAPQLEERYTIGTGYMFGVLMMLLFRMREAGIVPDMMKEYIDGFRWGCPPVRSSLAETSRN